MHINLNPIETYNLLSSQQVPIDKLGDVYFELRILFHTQLYLYCFFYLFTHFYKSNSICINVTTFEAPIDFSSKHLIQVLCFLYFSLLEPQHELGSGQHYFPSSVVLPNYIVTIVVSQLFLEYYRLSGINIVVQFSNDDVFIQSLFVINKIELVVIAILLYYIIR